MRKFLAGAVLCWMVAGVAFAQSDLYKFEPNQENSQEYKAVVAWIKGFDGGPDCSAVVRIKSDPIPGRGSYEVALAVCVKPQFDDVLLGAALLQRHPGVALVELKNAFKFGDPAKYENFRYIVEALQPKPPGPSVMPPQPANPVGPEFAPGKFFAVAGDAHPVGYVFTDPDSGRVFRKGGRPQIGSAWSYWYDELK